MAANSLKPIRPSDWDTRRSRHLLNRAGFGVTHERVAQLAGLGVEDAVRSLVEYDSTERNFSEPTFIPDVRFYQQWRRELREMDEDARREANQKQRREERLRVRALQGWWLERMLTTTRPLEEKMTLFWHGLLTSGFREVKDWQALYDQNQFLRRHAVKRARRQLNTADFFRSRRVAGPQPFAVDHHAGRADFGLGRNDWKPEGAKAT